MSYRKAGDAFRVRVAVTKSSGETRFLKLNKVQLVARRAESPADKIRSRGLPRGNDLCPTLASGSIKIFWDKSRDGSSYRDFKNQHSAHSNIVFFSFFS